MRAAEVLKTLFLYIQRLNLSEVGKYTPFLFHFTSALKSTRKET
jgi:hypothetical protein